MNRLAGLTPTGTIARALLGLALGGAVAMFGMDPDAGRDHSELGVWSLLIALQYALWLVLLPVLVSWLAEFKDDLGRDRWAVLTPALLMLLPLAGYSLGFWRLNREFVNPDQFAYMVPKVITITTSGYLVALVGVLGFWLVYAASQSRFTEATDMTASVSQFLALRRALDRFLGATGIILGLAVLSTGAFVTARNALGVGNASSPSGVWFDAAVYSGLLAVAYIPAHVALQERGRHLVDLILPAPSPTAESWAAWYAKRKDLETVMRLTSTGRASLRTALLILSPILGQAVSTLTRS